MRDTARMLDPDYLRRLPAMSPRDFWADEWVGLGWAGARKMKPVDDPDDPEADLDAYAILAERDAEENLRTQARPQPRHAYGVEKMWRGR